MNRSSFTAVSLQLVQVSITAVCASQFMNYIRMPMAMQEAHNLSFQDLTNLSYIHMHENIRCITTPVNYQTCHSYRLSIFYKRAKLYTFLRDGLTVNMVVTVVDAWLQIPALSMQKLMCLTNMYVCIFQTIECLKRVLRVCICIQLFIKALY